MSITDMHLVVEDNRKNFNKLGAKINTGSFLRTDFIEQYWSDVVYHLPQQCQTCFPININTNYAP